MQQWFGLSGPAIEKSPRDTPLYREFAHLDTGITRPPDESTILRFRYLLKANGTALETIATIDAMLAPKRLLIKNGGAVDATLIATPSSTKNSTGTRDLEMHSAKKGNQWHFGMKAHIGVDADSDLVHTIIGMEAHVNDAAQGHSLLHGNEQVVFADVSSGTSECAIGSRPKTRCS